MASGHFSEKLFDFIPWKQAGCALGRSGCLKRKSRDSFPGLSFAMPCGMCYFVTFSSHLTIPNITPIEMMQTVANTAQHCHIGHALYILGPRKRSRLPTAVSTSHRPCHNPSMLFGATLDTNDNPSGDMNSSATVRKK